MGQNAFSGCASLTSMNFPEGMESIGHRALSRCPALEFVRLPEAFHSRIKARNLGIESVYPEGFLLPQMTGGDSRQIGLVIDMLPDVWLPVITITGDAGRMVGVEASDSPEGPWVEWRNIEVGKNGTMEIQLGKEGRMRFYRWK